MEILGNFSYPMNTFAHLQRLLQLHILLLVSHYLNINLPVLNCVESITMLVGYNVNRLPRRFYVIFCMLRFKNLNEALLG